MDLTKLLVILLLCGGGFYMWKQNEEKKLLLAKLAELTEPAEEDTAVKPQLYPAKPLVETKVPTPRPRKPSVPPATHVNKHVVCTQCQGEGANMVRRNVGGTITDAKFMCGLCMGSGKREFVMPVADQLCPDCGGMGKRVVNSAPASSRSSGLGLSGGLNASDGAPTTTSCVRCLGRGYFHMPGLN